MWRRNVLVFASSLLCVRIWGSPTCVQSTESHAHQHWGSVCLTKVWWAKDEMFPFICFVGSFFGSIIFSCFAHLFQVSFSFLLYKLECSSWIQLMSTCRFSVPKHISANKHKNSSHLRAHHHHPILLFHVHRDTAGLSSQTVSTHTHTVISRGQLR